MVAAHLHVGTVAEEDEETEAVRHHLQLHPTQKMPPKGGQTSKEVQTHPHCRAVKNITSLGKTLIGVKNLQLAPGRTTLCQDLLNEIQTSLRK